MNQGNQMQKNQLNNDEIDPTVKKAAVVVGIIMLASLMAILLAIVYKIITWIV